MTNIAQTQLCVKPKQKSPKSGRRDATTYLLLTKVETGREPAFDARALADASCVVGVFV
jgi:hypothetical protein